MKEIVIFCQAPADIQYALSLYDTYQNESTFHFFAINVEGMYQFLTGLKLKNAHIEFIPYPNLNIRNPKSILKVRQYIKDNIKQHFRGLTNCEIYYFSNKYDWLVFAFIAYLAKRNKVFCYDHYAKSIPYEKNNIISAKKLIALLIYFYLTRIILHYEWVNNRGVMSFNHDKYGISVREIRVSKEIFTKYAYNVEDSPLQNSILFFDSNISNADGIENYEETLRSIINFFMEKGFTLYIKPHPRLGYSKFLDEYDVTILPAYIPGEFIAYSQFSAIVGISTVAIAKIAICSDVPVYSLMDLFTFKNTSKKETYRKYLIDQSDGKVMFIRDLCEFGSNVFFVQGLK